MNYKADKGRKWSFMSDTFIISWINHKKETINKKTLSTILCKWKQDSVVSFLLYLYSVFKNKHKLVHNQSPVMNRLCPFFLNLHK